jgi:hypothetical protein
MAYVLRGKLCGYICADCPELLSDVVVRLYRNRKQQNVTALAVANPKDTFAILTDDQVKEKASYLIAETKTDQNGAYTFELGAGQKYSGEAFEVDLYCGNVPHRKPGKKDPQPVQVSITTIQPMWRGNAENGFAAVWDYCVPQRNWCAVRSRFGAWTICGTLKTCQGGAPIRGAVVSAFDTDWIQDDPLGSGTTDSAGHFRIDYLREDFEKTPFSPIFNVECFGGPDVYFSATLGPSTILNENRSVGRTPGRCNIGPCFCVDLCSPDVQPPDNEHVPHWMKVWDFDIHPPATTMGSAFSPEGYAKGGGSYYVFGDNNSPQHGVLLRGNCPLTDIAPPNGDLEYRFRIGEWTWLGGGDGDATTLPTVAPLSLNPITEIRPTQVGYVSYLDAGSVFSWGDVIITSADVAADGWIHLNGKPVTVDMHDGTNSLVSITPSNFLRTDELLVVNSTAITSVHAVRAPGGGPGGMPKADAGRLLTAAEQEPIRRYTLTFEVRDAGNPGVVIYSDTLDSIILDNSSVVWALDMEELRSNACNPLAGAPTAHILYTLDHPHMSYFKLQILNNNGLVHDAPPLPRASFAAPPPPSNLFFHGGAGGPHTALNNGGFPADISGDPMCAYKVYMEWTTRHYPGPGASWTDLLYCKE